MAGNIVEWMAMDLASTTRAVEKQNQLKTECSKAVCGAPLALQGYGIDYTILNVEHRSVRMNRKYRAV